MTRYNGKPIRPAWAEIDLQALKENIHSIRRLIGLRPEIMAIVKADAYGHGALETAPSILAAGVTRLGVSLPEEGIALRKHEIKAPILVFTPLLVDQVAPVCAYDLSASLTMLSSAEALSIEAKRRRKKIKVHIKIDTGMGRVGISPEETVSFIQRVLVLPNLMVEGVYSHFATADEADLSYARQQLASFQQVLAALSEKGIELPIRHIANSGGIINLPESHFDLVRAGIILYGLYPSTEVKKELLPLRPALRLKARVTQVKRVPSGAGISYGQIYHTSRDTNIATLPIGYADGFSRLLSGKARVLIGGKPFPVVGRICMDQCMVETGDYPVKVGEEAVLIGRQGEEEIAADEIAGLLGTINYEVICMISDRVPRVYFEK